jgi:hypothetical protein
MRFKNLPALNMRFTGLFMLVLIIGSCGKHLDDKSLPVTSIDPANAKKVDSLARFRANDPMTFVGINEKDQIAFLLTKDTTDIFTYRIELLRKWKGLPHDYGELHLKQIESDSTYVFEGGNAECKVVIRVYGAKHVGRDYLELQRDCENDSLDITVNEFKRLTYKG